MNGDKASLLGMMNFSQDEDSRPLFYVGEDVLVKSGIPVGEENLKIVLGVCAMEKKSNSKPMREILDRLEKYMHIQTLIFDEDVILKSPIEDWPIVDVLIAFFSHGFPLDKAIAYANLRKPFLINDLESQYTLLDRREVYKTLVKEGISHPRYAVLLREENGTTDCSVTDSDDCIQVNGVMFQKPFVEKPISAEDHNINIYFPVSAGGGSQRLFRKVGSRSSVYSQVSQVRKKGSYIYEDFMPTDGTDVKVYTLGPDYAHAEARKSPALDGKVERDKNGKEIRYPVLLSSREKMLARKVCLAFKQNICGFDLLRASGKSYVCDVNGFSFVKNSVKYYDDCAKILGTMIMRACAPQLHIPWVLGSAPEDIPVVPTTSGSMMELRSVVAVIRHGDRTPKQKMKMEVKHKKFFDLFEKYEGYKSGHLKLKKPKQLQEVLDIARFLLSEQHVTMDPEIAEKKAKLQQLKLVLEMYGHFSGINRKVQLKYQPNGHQKRSSSEEDERPKEPSLLLIVKWGGELTPAGKIQAEDLGKAFRTLYPGGQGQFETPGLGFLRLHSTFRHDLKIYASDEGRVQMTAAAFAKGLLALEGELTPILVQMVKSANTNGLLDKQGESSKYQHVVKERLTHILNENREFTDEYYDKLAPTRSESLCRALDFIKNPFKLCQHVHNMVKELTGKVRALKLEHRTRDMKLYNGESWELLIRRWAKLEKDFKMKDGRFDTSKIPDIYDCIKYDLQHNQQILQYTKAQELFNCSKALADIVIPQEYGITVEEKLHISQSLCTPLMRKIMSDLEQCAMKTDDDQSTRLDSKYSKGVASPERFVRTRLYFTSESHIHSLLNMLRYGGLRDENTEEQWKKAMDYINATPELNYMTQIIIMMFEDPTKEFNSDERFHVELHFSPGANISFDEKSYIGKSHSSQSLTEQDKNKRHSFHVAEYGFDPTLPIKRLHERPLSAPMIIQEQEEIDEADIFDHHHHPATILEDESPEEEKVDEPPATPSKFTTVAVPESSLTGKTGSVAKEEGIRIPYVPKSPDPNIPEWDWDGDSEVNDPTHKRKKTDDCDAVSPIKSVSEPIEIKPQVLSSSYQGVDNDAAGISRNVLALHIPRQRERARSLSLEEKRSRSLEDKNPEQKTAVSEMHDRHYLTVHLPLAKDRHRHSFSSLFYLKPEFRDGNTEPRDLIRAHSTSVLISKSNAFEGFSMVPSLRPLQTLHNKLTLMDMDLFLKKATTHKFVTPISSPPAVHTPSASPCVQPLKAQLRGQSQPSSSNSSSAGPSSPTTSGPPLNSLINKLQNMFVDRQDSKDSMERRSSKGDNLASDEKCKSNNSIDDDSSLSSSSNSRNVSDVGLQDQSTDSSGHVT